MRRGFVTLLRVVSMPRPLDIYVYFTFFILVKLLEEIAQIRVGVKRHLWALVKAEATRRHCRVGDVLNEILENTTNKMDKEENLQIESRC